MKTFKTISAGWNRCTCCEHLHRLAYCRPKD